MIKPTSLALNGAFRGQTLTGQQRYATEIAQALRRIDVQVREFAPPGPLRELRLAPWLWAQSLGLVSRADRPLVTLTSRGPFFAPHHVVVVHDLFVFTHPEWYSVKYALTHRLALSAQLRSARLILAVSEPVARQVGAITGRPDEIQVVPNAPARTFRTRMERPSRSAVLAAHGLGDDGFLLAVASNDPRKNVSLLNRAVAMLSTTGRKILPVVIVGGGRGSAIFADANEGVAAVRRIGRVTDEELADLYASCRAVLLPSLDEGFGLPAVEALSAGARLLVSDIEVHRWVCGELAEYAPPTDVQAWAQLLAKASATPRHGDAEASSISRRIRERFNWDSSAAALVSALNATKT